MRSIIDRIGLVFQQQEDSAGPDIAGLAAALGAQSPQDYVRVTRDSLARMARVAERYVGDRDDAMDCAQEALILAIRKFDQFEGRAQINSWLHRIVVNCALAHLRKKARKAEVSIDDLLPTFDAEGFQAHPMTFDDISAEEMLVRDDARRQVHASIGALPDTHRVVLIMRDIEEMSLPDIAETLDLTQNAAKVRIHRARSALRRHLEPMLAEGRI